MKYSQITAYFKAVTVLALMAACTSPNTDYVGAKSLEPIKLPSDVNGEGLGELYPVPEGSTERLQTSTPLPPTVGLQSGIDATAFALGDRYWVLNNKTPSTTWSQLLEFWQAEQIAVLDQNVGEATMRSAWFTQAIQPGLEVRYQLELTRGLQYDSTEIHLINQVRQQGSAAGEWGDTSDNPNHNQWLIERLEPFLNNRPDALNDSFLASTLNLPARITYSETAKEPMLRIDIDSERSGPMLTRAMQQQPLYLYAADLSRDIYHINVIEPNQKTGVLNRLNPFSSQEPLESPYDLPTILANIDQTSEAARVFQGIQVVKSESLSNIPGYLMVVSELADGKKQLVLRKSNGEYLPLDEAKFVIDIIRRQLR